VTAQDHWLPPDNVQQNPSLVVAPRTSPTNIGFALLADLAAHDFGYCSASRLLDRTQKTLGTLSRMERYRGHFFNWYDTRTLALLAPSYVSTVDSGNLAGSLLVHASGCTELVDAPILPARIFGGLRVTLQVLADVARAEVRSAQQDRLPTVSGEVLRKIERQIEGLQSRPYTLSAVATTLSRLGLAATEIATAIGKDYELQWWASALKRCCNDHQDELRHLAAWTTARVRRPDKAWQHSSPDQCQRLSQLREALACLDAVPRCERSPSCSSRCCR